MVTPQQIKQFTDYCEQNLDFNIEEPPGYMSAPICALDSVFSIGICYRMTYTIVKRFCAFLGVNPLKTTISTSDVIDKIENVSDIDLENKYLSKHRTSTKNGITKVYAYRQFLKIMKQYNVESCTDIHNISGNNGFETAIKSITGQKSGLSLNYLYILSRMSNYVKVDRHIRAFVAKALPGYKFTCNDCITLVQGATEIMSHGTHPKMTPRHLDHIIWFEMSNK